MTLLHQIMINMDEENHSAQLNPSIQKYPKPTHPHPLPSPISAFNYFLKDSMEVKLVLDTKGRQAKENLNNSTHFLPSEFDSLSSVHYQVHPNSPFSLEFYFVHSPLFA